MMTKKMKTPVRRTSLISSVLLMTVLTGCTSLAPDYERPDAGIPQQWLESEVKSADVKESISDTQTAADIPWQDFFQDERLQQVIQLALDNNRSLQATFADVAAARASYRSTNADRFPSLDAGINGTRARTRTTGSDTQTSTSWEAVGGVSSYEFDLFGAAASATESDWQSYLSTEETARAAKISLIAETASAWLSLASDQNLLALAKETAASAQRTMEISEKRKALGVDSGLDLLTAQSTYQSARADIANYQTLVAQDKNALWLLVGHQLGQNLLPEGLPKSEAIMEEIPAGVPSDVLLSRPDVLAAEHSLQSANANIGTARAAYFPSLSLTSTGGLASAALADLFSGGAATIWTIAPSLTLPIFSWGGNKADVDYATSQRDSSLATYQYTVQTAFKEVADALARRETIQEQMEASSEYVNSASRAYGISMKRYESGVISLQDALEYQRTLYGAQQSLTSLQLEELSNRITLYRVLGGGLAEAKKDDSSVALLQPVATGK